VEEFIAAADDFHRRSPDDGISGFLSDLALVRDLDEDAEGARHSATEAVQLMTLHASKGKEFRTVFVAGLEEELFPHYRALEGQSLELKSDDVEESEALREERRLFFVGLTRAKDQVFLTRARSRVRHGQSRPSRASRFLHELPLDLVEILDPEHLDALAIEKAPSETTSLYRPGDPVEHSHYGRGTVVGFMGRSFDARVLVDFESHGVKELYLQHTRLRRSV
ncbi:MAG: 3'-5' exonuclease, partial [Planctomycetota bacterium]